MIVKNGALVIADKVANRGGRRDFTKIDGTIENATLSMQSLRPEVLASNSGVIMRLGSGTTAPTADDYCLESPIDESKYHCISAGGSQAAANVVVADNGDLLYTYVFSIDDDVEINEIDLEYFTQTGDRFMLARQIVPTRTASAGDMISFTYVIKCGGD